MDADKKRAAGETLAGRQKRRGFGGTMEPMEPMLPATIPDPDPLAGSPRHDILNDDDDFHFDEAFEFAGGGGGAAGFYDGAGDRREDNCERAFRNGFNKGYVKGFEDASKEALPAVPTFEGESMYHMFANFAADPAPVADILAALELGAKTSTRLEWLLDVRSNADRTLTDGLLTSVVRPLGAGKSGTLSLMCFFDNTTGKFVRRGAELPLLFVLKNTPRPVNSAAIAKLHERPAILYSKTWTTHWRSEIPEYEALIMSLLTRLVTSCRTPHFGIMANVRFFDKAVEMWLEPQELTLREFYEKTMDPLHQLRIMQTVLWQVTQALYMADDAFEFQHNDLHAMNVMVSRAAPHVYKYVLGDVLVDVPNNGICTKIIDAGLSSSTLLFGRDDYKVMLETYRTSIEHGDFSAVTKELADVFRLLSYCGLYMDMLAKPVKAFVDTALDKITDMSRGHEHSVTTGLLRTFALWLADECGFKTEIVPADFEATASCYTGHVYGLKHSMLANLPELTTLEDTYLKVDAYGNFGPKYAARKT